MIKIKKIILFISLSVIALLLFLVSAFSANALTISPPRVELTGDPGQIISQEMILINERDTPETYYVSYANFEAQGETGNPAFIDAKDDLGTWMQAPNSVSLDPGMSKIVPIKITIPKNADPGGHFAVIFWGTIPPNANTNSVAIGAKTGMLILLRVNGDVNENGGLLEFATKNKQKFFTALPITFFYRFQNSGGDRIKPKGEIEIKDILGIVEKRLPGNPVEGNILPDSIRKFETVWQGKDGPKSSEEKDQGGFFGKARYEFRNFSFGYYSAKISLAYGVKNEIAEGNFSFWVFPWHLVICVLILLLILFFTGRKLIRHYNHWVILQAEKMLKKEEAQKEAHEHNSNHKRAI